MNRFNQKCCILMQFKKKNPYLYFSSLDLTFWRHSSQGHLQPFLYPPLLSAPPPRHHRSFSGATLTCPGPSLCRGNELPNGSHHLHPRRKRHFSRPAVHDLPHLTRYANPPPPSTIQLFPFLCPLFTTSFDFVLLPFFYSQLGLRT